MKYATFGPVLVTVGLLALATVPAAAQSDSAATDAAAETIVSSQLRAQGYQCDDPHSAEPDQGDSSPGELAWIITCNNAKYRVKLVPDQAAKVEQID